MAASRAGGRNRRLVAARVKPPVEAQDEAQDEALEQPLSDGFIVDGWLISILAPISSKHANQRKSGRLVIQPVMSHLRKILQRGEVPLAPWIELRP